MIFFEKIHTYLNTLDKKTWYHYLAISAGVFLLAIGLILFFYYNSVGKWKQRIEEINEERQKVKEVLDKAQRVQEERTEVTALLAKDPDFKIKEYIQEVLEKIGILGNFSTQSDVVTTTQDNYKEQVVTYKLTGITMKQLAEFLNEIDTNKRVFTTELEITKSKKIPRTIDVDIKIATMMPKEAT